MHKTVALCIVGLTPKLLGPAMPKLTAWAQQGAMSRIKPAFPAVTCTAQSDYVTGQYPDTHGIVGNGWYSREDCEVRFWKQSNRLVHAPKVWEAARRSDASFTCANLFWWFNMYSTTDYSVTPRPMYPADGRKIPDVHTAPGTLRDELQAELGTFPLFEFWGPRASIKSSQWIAAAAKRVEEKHNPTLTLIYLPHLDYNLQKAGPDIPKVEADLRSTDDVAGDLVQFYEERGARVLVLSEYGIVPVSTPVHVNRALRQAGMIAVREELGLEVFDPGASAAFAVADHQVAHVYVNDQRSRDEVRSLLDATPGIDVVLDEDGQRDHRVRHPRSGDFIAVAKPDAWFTYYYWLDDARAPDYARTVDIHRKPGYDPVELFLDPAITSPALSIGWKLAKRKAGFRTLLDVTPLDATLVRGSHGRFGEWSDDGPCAISREKSLFRSDQMMSVDVCSLMLRHLGVGV
jgi:predicted AlkP superfamily pyrophosphatase or phosphodiesterase